MELQLQKDSQKAVQIQEQKVQLEEAVVKLRHNEREMKNTLEKFTASIQVLFYQCLLILLEFSSIWQKHFVVCLQF